MERLPLSEFFKSLNINTKGKSPSHSPGVPFKGPSGGWFVVRPSDMRTVRTKDPNKQTKPSRNKPGKKEDPKKVRLSKPNQQGGEELPDGEELVNPDEKSDKNLIRIMVECFNKMKKQNNMVGLGDLYLEMKEEAPTMTVKEFHQTAADLIKHDLATLKSVPNPGEIPAEMQKYGALVKGKLYYLFNIDLKKAKEETKTKSSPKIKQSLFKV